MKDISITFERGKFYGIFGKVGSGKSGLLNALLEEMPSHVGKLERNGSISYVEQEPVIFSTSVKSNILFGKEYIEDKYEKALYKSCLVKDL